MFQGISLTQAPPFGVIVSFFLNAQVYLFLAGVCAFLLSSEIYLGNPLVIMLIHCVSIGFLLLIMFGSIFQMLPVLAGVKITREKLLASVILCCINIGLFLFLLGFYFLDNFYLTFSVILLAFGIGLFLFNIIITFFKVQHFTPTIIYMILAFFSLFIVVLCGLAMLGSYAGLWSIAWHSNLLTFHIILGGFGWIFLLIFAISLQVLPMFYVSPACPKYFYTLIIPCLLVLLMASLCFDTTLKIVLILCAAIMLLFGIFIVITLKNRKRKILDSSIFLWYFGGYNAILFAIFIGVTLLCERFDLAIAPLLLQNSIVIFLFGFVFSILYAMLYKIVPFLAWFHLVHRGSFNLPNLREIISPLLVKLQVYSFMGAYVGMLFAVVFSFYYIVAFFLVLCSLIAIFNILKAYKIYRVC